MKLPVKVTVKKHAQKDSVNQENHNNKASTIYSLKEETSILLPSLKLDRPVMAVTGLNLEDDSNTISCVKESSESESTTLETRTCEENLGKGVMEEEELLESRQTNSRASSVYDDSGFNSCASDRDDGEESLLNIDFCSDVKDDNDEGFDNERTLVCELQSTEQDLSASTVALPTYTTSRSDSIQSITVSNVSDSDVPSASPLRLEEVDTTSVGSGNVSLTTPADNIPLTTPADNIPLTTPVDNIPLTTPVDNISLTTPVRRRGIELSSLVLPSERALRQRQLRRRRHRDCNNNHTRCRDLHSYLGKAPFRLVDCFQERGLLSLAACIAYTLTLVFLCGVLSFMLDGIKSAVGRENLKDMRDNIIQSRRSRSGVTSG